ncbi:site-specific integrase [Nordella sp. HKS 07]|uniref:tyrosine-type recombinase/integrase n=1 Tax=Nordella sp. HKS 07 TaxID=2712222 RepID=UPI0013E1693B|nr:site-specific integrase [Nordella sp. HKS 07]QIG50386.1 site-specific integrase [Nordella sp. HKS 07]
MPRLTETRALRAKLPKKGTKFDWCSEVRTFGARYTPGSRTWVVYPRCTNGIRVMIALGAVGVLPFEGPPHRPGARDLAIAAITAARRGEDPRVAIGQANAPEGLTLAEVWQAYADAGFPKLKGTGRKRASTIKRDTDRYNYRIKPMLGGEAVSRIDTARVRRWLDTIEADGQRNHSLVLLKSLLSFAASRNLATTQAIAISAQKSKEMQNFYTTDELVRLDAAMVELMREKPERRMGFAALRLLLLTGARKGQILSLRWSDVDLKHGVLALEKDKTSENRRDILLLPEAVAILKGLPRRSSSFVFPADSKSGHTVNIEKHLNDAVERAGVNLHRIHDLRHSFASAAIRTGTSLYVTGQLLGHKQATTTQRYAHLEHDVAREALERIAKAIGG